MIMSQVNTESDPFVISRDGARISYLSLGSGPAVIVIPGALSAAADYLDFGNALAEHFTVHIIERRGRGLSSPQGDEYGMAKECEDLLALQRHTGATLLVGHSFGGLVALEVARRTPIFTKIALYEPGVSIDGSISMTWIPRYEQLLDKRKYLDAFVEFTIGAGPERVRHIPRWYLKLLLPLFMHSREREQRLALLRENLREHQEVARLDSSVDNYRTISAKVLLMYGGKSDSPWVTLAMERLAAILPQSGTLMFPKLDHFGIDKKAPAEVARVAGTFLLAESTTH